jgi:hypothetical protein
MERSLGEQFQMGQARRCLAEWNRMQGKYVQAHSFLPRLPHSRYTIPLNRAEFSQVRQYRRSSLL